MEEDTRTLVPVVLGGDTLFTNNSLHVTADHGQLVLARGSGNGSGDIVTEAGEYLNLQGSKDEINEALGRVWYAPLPDWNSHGLHGFENLTILLSHVDTIHDGDTKAEATRWLLVRVAPVNDGPSLRSPDKVFAREAEDTVIQGIKVADPDVQEASGVMEVTVSTNVSGSNVELATRLGLYVTHASPERKRFLGSLSSVNAALAGLIYRGPPEFSGNDELAIHVNDGGNAGEGGSLTVSAIVPIHVISVNTPPRVIREEGLLETGLEDKPITLTGIVLEDDGAGDADVKLTIEARYGTIALATDNINVEFETGDGEQDIRTEAIGSLQVR